MGMQLRVFVATDLSAPADEAIRQAHALSAGGGALGVCHVVPHLQTVSPLFPQNTEQTIFDVSAILLKAEVAIRQRIVELTGREEGSFEVFIDQGVDYAEVARRAAAWKADLLVVGSHGQTGLVRLLLGGVAERIVRYAPCPVLVARPAAAHAAGTANGPVIAATDMSDPALKAIEAGAREARRRGTSLVVVHAIDLGPTAALQSFGIPLGVFPPYVSSDTLDGVKEAAKASLASMMKEKGIEGEIEVAVGSAPEAVVRAAERRNAALVVVGTHGRTGFAQIALGSVAEKVVRACPSSVLVVRSP